MGSRQRATIRRGCPVGEVIRRSKDGKFLGFYLRWYEGGKRRVMASKQESLTDARKMLLQIEARIARGEAGIAEAPAEVPTLARLIERFLAEYSRPRIKDVERYRIQARVALIRVVPQLGSKRADTITAIDVGRLRDALSRRYAANSVRQTIATLGTAYAWGNRIGIVAGNPCRGIELPQRVDALDYLTTDEVKALLSYATERAASGGIADRLQHARIVVAIHTGLRKGELCGLRWRDLDLRSHRLTIARSYRAAPKSGKPRHIRLPAVAIPILAEWVKVCPMTDEGVVFPVRRRDGRWAMSEETSDLLGLPALLTAAGVRVPSHCWHVLRHTFASHYVMQGGNLLALSRILGHSDVKVTMIYAHLAPDFIGAEMNRVKF